MKYKINKKLLRFIVIITLPILFTKLTILYFTPKINSISFNYACKEENNCEKVIDENRINAIQNEMNSKSMELKFLNSLSKFPLSDFILFDFKFTNRSEVKLSVTEPQREIIEPANIVCNNGENSYEFSNNSGIIFQQKSNLDQIINNLNSIVSFPLNSCRPASHRFNLDDTKVEVAPAAWVKVDIYEKYDIECILDLKSQIVLYVVWLIITFVSLPLIKQVMQFLIKGRNYFIE